jgi:hypothetical protein
MVLFLADFFCRALYLVLVDIARCIHLRFWPMGLDVSLPVQAAFAILDSFLIVISHYLNLICSRIRPFNFKLLILRQNRCGAMSL